MYLDETISRVLNQKTSLSFLNSFQTSVIFKNYDKDFDKSYKIVKKLDGVYSSPLYESFQGQSLVYETEMHIRKTEKLNLSEPQLSNYRNQIRVQYQLSHLCNNIVKIFDVFEDKDSFYLVLEKIPEKNILSEIINVFFNITKEFNPIEDEKTLKNYARDLLTAIKVCHDNDVIHGDIGLHSCRLFIDDGYSSSESENGKLAKSAKFSDLTTPEDDPEYILKLDNFERCEHLEDNGKCIVKEGASQPNLMAPEVKIGNYVDKKVDIWAFGLSLYTMACAYLPSSLKLYRYGDGKIPFRTADWVNFNEVLIKDLITKCLEVDPDKRISAEQALDHLWFNAPEL